MSESDCPEIPRFRMDNETRRRNDDDASLPRVFVLLFFFFCYFINTHLRLLKQPTSAHFQTPRPDIAPPVSPSQVEVSLTPPNLHVDVAFLVSLAWTAIMLDF